jgi:hypothetical protein
MGRAFILGKIASVTFEMSAVSIITLIKIDLSYSERSG